MAAAVGTARKCASCCEEDAMADCHVHWCRTCCVGLPAWTGTTRAGPRTFFLAWYQAEASPNPGRAERCLERQRKTRPWRTGNATRWRALASRGGHILDFGEARQLVFAGLQPENPHCGIAGGVRLGGAGRGLLRGVRQGFRGRLQVRAASTQRDAAGRRGCRARSGCWPVRPRGARSPPCTQHKPAWQV